MISTQTLAIYETIIIHRAATLSIGEEVLKIVLHSLMNLNYV